MIGETDQLASEQLQGASGRGLAAVPSQVDGLAAEIQLRRLRRFPLHYAAREAPARDVRSLQRTTRDAPPEDAEA